MEMGDAGGRSSVVVVVETMTGDTHSCRNARVVVGTKMGTVPVTKMWVGPYLEKPRLGLRLGVQPA
jgi:hypothetical protein